MARKGLTLIGGKTRRLQKASHKNWSQARAKAFLNVLADTCNATEASRESGLSLSSVSRRKKADASFRASWFEAIAIAYQRLELVMLERAFNGTEKVLIRRDGSEDRMREYSNQLVWRCSRCTARRPSKRTWNCRLAKSTRLGSD